MNDRNTSEARYLTATLVTISCAFMVWHSFGPAALAVNRFMADHLKDYELAAVALLALGAVYAQFRKPGGHGLRMEALKKFERATFKPEPYGDVTTPERWIMENCHFTGGADQAAEALRTALRASVLSRSRETSAYVLNLSFALDATGGGGGRELRRKLAEAMHAGGENAKELRKLGHLHPEARACADLLSKDHGTDVTKAMALLDAARAKRHVPTSEFAWLKDVDRPRWYALSNLGRPTFHVEGIAAMALYREESEAGVPLTEPTGTADVDALMPYAAGFLAAAAARRA